MSYITSAVIGRLLPSLAGFPQPPAVSHVRKARFGVFARIRGCCEESWDLGLETLIYG